MSTLALPNPNILALPPRPYTAEATWHPDGLKREKLYRKAINEAREALQLLRPTWRLWGTDEQPEWFNPASGRFVNLNKVEKQAWLRYMAAREDYTLARYIGNPVDIKNRIDTFYSRFAPDTLLRPGHYNRHDYRYPLDTTA